jgi:hypothetical protein
MEECLIDGAKGVFEAQARMMAQLKAYRKPLVMVCAFFLFSFVLVFCFWFYFCCLALTVSLG